MLPFLLNKLVIPVGLIVPIGSIFLTLLISYGLLECTGTLLHSVMKPVWRTPGWSAIDAVASFVGSYSIAFSITNRLYIKGQYSTRQAAIIATGFSTVSAAFMIIVANTLNLMEIWGLYFWTTLIITFTVTAITTRIPPLSGLNDQQKAHSQEEPISECLFQTVINSGLQAARNALPLQEDILKNFKDGLIMTITILPTIMSVGAIGLLVHRFNEIDT